MTNSFTTSFLIKDSVSLTIIKDLVKNTPNDSELGKAVRIFINSLEHCKVYKNSTLEFDEKIEEAPNKE